MSITVAHVNLLNQFVSAGGPLYDGDIEEADGALQVFCPWHDYDFNLRTGKSNTGLQVSGMRLAISSKGDRELVGLCLHIFHIFHLFPLS